MGGMEGRMSCRERNARRNQETFSCKKLCRQLLLSATVEFSG
jgi:hypothetical protein